MAGDVYLFFERKDIMGFFSWLGSLFGSNNLDDGLDQVDNGVSHDLFEDESDINPATGLPMMGGVDVEGNPYGVDLHDDTFDNFTGMIDDDIGGFSTFDDDF